ncbi:DUF7281 domain-containing protein [Marinobacter psychrophilus]|jgi:hypothetical protein|uniref:DUF7281 domain-containing protein n=1 Tax=Marinobacter psychrophilus TaxID=330734 RepID=UPI001B61BB26|nr:hypothetical protein [Marinobacter psychrophilus]MBQ0763163.1 hypothetical protein [Marinobacter psychrophilus]MBQ0843946.1 hypothetical protein [Marinobacter psychrophilus]
MKAEFKAIATLLQGSKRSAARNKVWTRIHHETGLGTVSRRDFLFSEDELNKLRQYGRSLTGGELDPLFYKPAGLRMDMAEVHNNEKFTSHSVFGSLMLMATAGGARVVINGEPSATQPGSILAVKPDPINREALTQQKLIVIENGSLMPDWSRIVLPEAWQDAVLLYRGHGENARDVIKLALAQPSDRLAFYYDFDPAGMAMALNWGRGHILVPQDWPALDCSASGGLSQRGTYRQQHASLNMAQAAARTEQQRRILAFMANQECAIMQEHITARALPLVAIAG